MQKVCSGNDVVRGFDASHWQPDLDFKELKRKGYDFCFIKASEGVNVQDPSFDRHWFAAKEAGLIRGAYHFFHPNQDSQIQARHFMSVIGEKIVGDLPPFMDWEAVDGIPNSDNANDGYEFIREMDRKTGIYGSPYFLEALKLGPAFSVIPLWVSHFKVPCPMVPTPWNTWMFWQSNGISLDTNTFNGSLDELKVLTI